MNPGWAFLAALVAVAVGALLAGLPNRSTNRRLAVLERQQTADNRRFMDLLLANGSLATFVQLQNLDKPVQPAPSVAMDSDEMALWRTHGEVDYGYDNAFDLPEFPIGPDLRDADAL
jgi:hypothetical protein